MRWYKEPVDYAVLERLTDVEFVRALLCRELQYAKGRWYTLKPSRICRVQLLLPGSAMCRVLLRGQISVMLVGTIVLVIKNGLVVDVVKARERLGC